MTVAFIGMLALPACAQLVPNPVVGEAPKPGPAAYTLEGLGAAGMGVAIAALPALAFVAGGLASIDNNGGSDVPALVCGCVALGAYSAGSGLGAGTVGRALHFDGNSSLSYDLAFVPPVMLIGAGIVYALKGSDPSDQAWNAALVTLIAGPPIMATVGYNIGVTPGYASSHSRLEPPSFAARLEQSRGAEHRTVVALDAKLLCVRF